MQNYYILKSLDLFNFIDKGIQCKSEPFTPEIGRELSREFNVNYLAIDTSYCVYRFPSYDYAIHRAIEYSKQLIQLAHDRPNILDIQLTEYDNTRIYTYIVDNCMSAKASINQLEAYFINTKPCAGNSNEWCTRGVTANNVEHVFDKQWQVKIYYHLND